tara:strand:- start:1101 stop:1556 length:456 start_codon:yes stop_codon:yes gene_type:complete
MNRIAKVWEELDKKNGRHANLSKAGKRKNVKLSKVTDFEALEAEEDRINDDLMRLADDTGDVDNLINTMLSNAEQIMTFNEDYLKDIETIYSDLTDQFEELGMDIESMPVGKLYEERKMAYDYVNEEVNKFMYKTLERFENQIRAIIGSKK